MDDRETVAGTRFACDDRERALFEVGIKMGTLYHQFVGTPVSAESVGRLEKAMSEAIGVQPYVVESTVRIDRSRIPTGDGVFEYTSLTGDMIDGVIRVVVGRASVTAEMRYDAELDYPLMFVSSIEDLRP